jgi:ribosomal protein L16 Arg81 hydroxylase
LPGDEFAMLTRTAAPPPPLAHAAGHELRSLLWPVTPETFVHDYWAKKPLFVKGFKDKYQGFFDGEAFRQALAAPGLASDDVLRASFDAKTGSGSSAAPKAGEASSSVFRASIEQAVPLFKAGATLCLSQIETRVPALANFLAAIKRQLGYPGKASFSAYLSPPGSGFNWHFDGRIASTLQIEGTKRWRFSNRAAIAWPRGNGTLRADGTAHYADPGVTAQAWEQLAPFDADDTNEVLLEPGDLLILPAGLWHEACGGDEGSLALNLSFTPVPYTLLVRNLLESLLTPEAEWRSMPPVLPGRAAGDADAQGLAAISAQLARASELLASLSGDSAAVVRLWQSFVHSPNPGTPAPPPHDRSTSPVLPSQRLRLRGDGDVSAMRAEGGTRLFVKVGTGSTIEVSGEAVPFVQRILAEREFVASDCLSWSQNGAPFEWADVELMLTRLQGEGLLESARA